MGGDPVLDGTRSGPGAIYYLSLKSSSQSFNLFNTLDGGQSWNTVYADILGGDKPWMVIDRNSTIGCGNIYVYWRPEGSACAAQPCQFIRSVDGGHTWSAAISLPNSPQIGTMAVGPEGELYICGQSGAALYVLKSIDARDPSMTPSFPSWWALPLPLCGGAVPTSNPAINPDGILAQTWIACDTSSTSRRGNVYVLSSMHPPAGPTNCPSAAGTDGCVSGPVNDPLDIWFWRGTPSTGGGLTWYGPRRINDDCYNTNAWQWFGTMSVAPNGRIDVVWNDNRHFLGDVATSELYYAFSSDGGQTWSPNQAISGCWVNSSVRDYYHMISDDVGAHLAWAACFDQTTRSRVYYTRITPFYTPTPFLAPPAALPCLSLEERPQPAGGE